MFVFILIFLMSFFINFILSKRKFSFSVDKTEGVQKFHSGNISRLGGFGIFLSFSFFLIFQYIKTKEIRYIYLLISSLPVFTGGFLEDITKNISPKKRLIFTSFSALLSIILFQVYISRLDIFFIDNLLSTLPIAYIFTIFAITGVSNAYNIIDGFNGLASSFALLVFISFAYIGYIKNDIFILNVSMAMIFSILGFFILNYPLGKIFLGDGGAYFIGFLIGFISVYIVFKYKDVSSWYPFLLSIYPIWETIFSIYRKKFLKNISPMEPDGLHSHMLIYKRIVNKIFKKTRENKLLRNSLVSPILLLFHLPYFLFANLYWNNTYILLLLSLIYIFIYISLYRKIIKFKLKFLDRN